MRLSRAMLSWWSRALSPPRRFSERKPFQTVSMDEKIIRDVGRLCDRPE
jgi:hypothetical protein